MPPALRSAINRRACKDKIHLFVVAVMASEPSGINILPIHAFKKFALNNCSNMAACRGFGYTWAAGAKISARFARWIPGNSVTKRCSALHSRAALEYSNFFKGNMLCRRKLL